MVVLLPVYSLHQDQDFLPGPVGPRLPVDDGVSEQLLQTLHVCNTRVDVNQPSQPKTEAYS